MRRENGSDHAVWAGSAGCHCPSLSIVTRELQQWPNPSSGVWGTPRTCGQPGGGRACPVSRVEPAGSWFCTLPVRGRRPSPEWAADRDGGWMARGRARLAGARGIWACVTSSRGGRWLLTSLLTPSACIPLQGLTLTRLCGAKCRRFKILLRSSSAQGRWR